MQNILDKTNEFTEGINACKLKIVNLLIDSINNDKKYIKTLNDYKHIVRLVRNYKNNSAELNKLWESNRRKIYDRLYSEHIRKK